MVRFKPLPVNSSNPHIGVASQENWKLSPMSLSKHFFEVSVSVGTMNSVLHRQCIFMASSSFIVVIDLFYSPSGML